MTLQTQDALAYVEAIELPPLPQARPGPAAIVADTPAALVVDGSLISFVSNVDNPQDVLNSTLFAQLAANRAYDRFADTVNWYKKYLEVLTVVGWGASAFGFQQYSILGSSFTMDKAVLSILSAIATGNQLQVIQATLTALQACGDNSNQLTLWQNSGSSKSSGAFQISPVSQGLNGTLAMMCGAFYFRTTQTTKRFLWFGYSSSSIELFYATQTMVLNEGVYAGVRQAIAQRLGDRAAAYVAALDIG